MGIPYKMRLRMDIIGDATTKSIRDGRHEMQQTDGAHSTPEAFPGPVGENLFDMHPALS